MDETEIDKLKLRLEKIDNIGKNNNPKTTINQNSTERKYDNDANQPTVENIKKDESIFGSELFLKSSLVFEPNIRIATPSSYILGPDDELILNVYGYSEMKYNLEVNENGEVYIPNVGPIYVNGLSIQQATSKIKSKLASTIYRAINSGQTKININLGKIKSIRVTVIGEAYKPGTYTVSSLTTLYNLLYLCGGPSDMGSFRTIEIIRGNSLYKKADLYDFLTKGDQKDNIILQEGDVIRIPYYQNRVKITGNIKRPGKYEMKENEKVEQLLLFCGSFNELAYKSAATVTRITSKDKKVIDISEAMFSNFAVQNGDEFFINKLQNIFIDKVTLTGAVYRPGNYEAKSSMTIKSLLENAGGILEEAYMDRINIYRLEKGKSLSIFSINLDSIIQNGLDFVLEKGDSVHVYSSFDFKDNQFVVIEGNVRKPGKNKWRENLTIKELLLEAGGINDYGDSTTIEVSRKKKKNTSNALNFDETETFFINVSQKGKLGEELILEPFDIVNVKVVPGVINQRTVIVLGEVLTPGKYNLQKSGDKISDILKRVGGFKASADSTTIFIRRKRNSTFTVSEREMLFQRLLNIDLDSIASNQQLKNELYNEYELITVDLAAILENNNNFENLFLEDGDILTISKSNNLVKISGEVYYPTITPIQKHKSAKYYIKQAGGFTTSARKMKTLIIYPNGKVKPIRSFLGIKKYPRIFSRAEIFVPQKNKENRNKIGPAEMALLVSALGIISNVILTAVKK
jgi:protein involved in polysaccharide export with SLBB domain